MDRSARDAAGQLTDPTVWIEGAFAFANRDIHRREGGGPLASKGSQSRRLSLSAGADAELGEHLAQVPLDGAWAEEQLSADVGVRAPVSGEPGDLGFLAG
jgi:hypothetical protein